MHEDATLTVKVQPEVKNQLATLATSQGLTLSYYLRLLVEQHCRTPLKLGLRPVQGHRDSVRGQQMVEHAMTALKASGRPLPSDADQRLYDYLRAKGELD